MSELITESNYKPERLFSQSCFWYPTTYLHSTEWSFDEFVTTTGTTGEFSIDTSECFEYVSLPESSTNFDTPYSWGDSQTRERLWNTLFPHKTLPKIKKDAVEKNYGIMDKYLEKTKVSSQDLKRIVEEALNE